MGLQWGSIGVPQTSWMDAGDLLPRIRETGGPHFRLRNLLDVQLPLLSLSSRSNSASMNFIHSRLEILPLLSVSISSSNCLTSSSPRASLSAGFGTDCFCATALPGRRQDAAKPATANATFLRFNTFGSFAYVDTHEQYRVRDLKVEPAKSRAPKAGPLQLTQRQHPGAVPPPFEIAATTPELRAIPVSPMQPSNESSTRGTSG